IPDWERMLMVREFHAHHRYDPGFARWFEQAKLLSGMIPTVQLPRLDLLGRPAAMAPTTTAVRPAAKPPVAEPKPPANGSLVDRLSKMEETNPEPPAAAAPAIPPVTEKPPRSTWADWIGWGSSARTEPLPANDDLLPLSVILDENGGDGKSIHAGRETGTAKPVTLNRDVLKRHAAVLGGSGSGKTTLALSLIEQLLLSGIPAVLLDRKGDLCSYANPDVWRINEDELQERRGEREKLADAIDVAV